MEQHNKEFGIRWLLRRLGICPNAYYNYRKHRKADCYARKEAVKAQIREIYHVHNGGGQDTEPCLSIWHAEVTITVQLPYTNI